MTEITRRSLLEWLGTETVLALGGELLAACRAWAAPADLPFRPGEREGRIFEDWGVRTVDPQDLTQILATWRLEVGGLVDRPHTYFFADLTALPRTDLTADFHCVEGWSVLDVPWNGVLLGELLERAGPQPGATHVNFRTVRDAYNESLPLGVAREPETLLAYGVQGATLPLSHGFPLRVVVPRLLGYKSCKYVYRIELASKPLHGYWVGRGYDYLGEVPERRLRPGKY